jgi:hypothetical protein
MCTACRQSTLHAAYLLHADIYSSLVPGTPTVYVHPRVSDLELAICWEDNGAGYEEKKSKTCLGAQTFQTQFKSMPAFVQTNPVRASDAVGFLLSDFSLIAWLRFCPSERADAMHQDCSLLDRDGDLGRRAYGVLEQCANDRPGVICKARVLLSR